MSDQPIIDVERTRLVSLVKLGVEVVEDFMTNLAHCALQDYGRLNEFLISSKKLLQEEAARPEVPKRPTVNPTASDPAG